MTEKEEQYLIWILKVIHVQADLLKILTKRLEKILNFDPCREDSKR